MSLLLGTRPPTCYTALNHGRSAKPARSLLTELFLPHGPGFTLTSMATCHTGPRKLDICLYIGRNGASARRSRDVTERAARDLHYHPETGGTRDGCHVKRTDRRCRCPNPHRPGLPSRGTSQACTVRGVRRPRRAPSEACTVRGMHRPMHAPSEACTVRGMHRPRRARHSAGTRPSPAGDRRPPGSARCQAPGACASRRPAARSRGSRRCGGAPRARRRRRAGGGRS